MPHSVVRPCRFGRALNLHSDIIQLTHPLAGSFNLVGRRRSPIGFDGLSSANVTYAGLFTASFENFRHALTCEETNSQ